MIKIASVMLAIKIKHNVISSLTKGGTYEIDIKKRMCEKSFGMYW